MNSFSQGLGKRSEEVLLTLRGELDRGTYRPGDKLPKEQELCERFGVSRPTVRRAIARLVEEGRVRVKRRAGMFVCDHEPERVGSRTIAVMGMFEPNTLMDLQKQAMVEDYLLSPFLQPARRWDVDTERKFLERVKAERYHALMAFCTPRQPRNDDLLQALDRTGTRVIHIEHYCEELPRQEYILPDYHGAGYNGAVALMLAGYEQILYAGMADDGPYGLLQYAGFCHAVRTHRPDSDPENLFMSFPRFGREDDAADRVRAELQKHSGSIGIHCRSGNIADHITEVATDMGLRIPEDIGLITAGPTQDEKEEGDCDKLNFDRPAILQRALTRAMNPKAAPLHELVAPTMIRCGTVKTQ